MDNKSCVNYKSELLFDSSLLLIVLYINKQTVFGFYKKSVPTKQCY